MAKAHFPRGWSRLLIAVGIVLPGMMPVAGADSVDGFYRVEQREGRWWLIDPSGRPTLSKGVCHIAYEPDRIQGTGRSLYGEANQAKYGGPEKWREAAARRLLSWGFNSLGAWSDPMLSAVELDGRRLADSPIINMGSGFVSRSHSGDHHYLKGLFPDVFDPEFEVFCRHQAAEKCAPRRDDKTILGWFTDNELRWGPDWRRKDELLTMFLNMPAKAHGRLAALGLVRARHQDIKRFNAVWKTSFGSWADLEAATKVEEPVTRRATYAQNKGEEKQSEPADPDHAAFAADCEAFLEELAERYFRITREALRAADPNHLNFGCRFAIVPPEPVRRAAARYLDVISFNCYEADPRPTARYYSALGRPLIIGEFAFRGADAGLPNTRGPGPVAATQTERAAAFEHYVRRLLAEPEVVGYHWFQHNDQPKEGRFDGENSNYGVVNSQDEAYPELTQKMAAVNAQAEAWHREKDASEDTK